MYSNWDEKLCLLNSPLYWYSVIELVNYLHALKRFIIHTPAKYSEPHAPKLPEKFIPASQNERFPKESSYLCEGIGNWNIELDLLEISANIMINKNRITRNYPNYNTPGEVEIFALTKINQLLQIIQQHQQQQQEDYHELIVLKQYDFEQYYGLTWIEEEDNVNGDNENNDEFKQ